MTMGVGGHKRVSAFLGRSQPINDGPYKQYQHGSNRFGRVNRSPRTNSPGNRALGGQEPARAPGTRGSGSGSSSRKPADNQLDRFQRVHEARKRSNAGIEPAYQRSCFGRLRRGGGGLRNVEKLSIPV